jgi:hypothetical protein
MMTDIIFELTFRNSSAGPCRLNW